VGAGRDRGGTVGAGAGGGSSVGVRSGCWPAVEKGLAAVGGAGRDGVARAGAGGAGRGGEQWVAVRARLGELG
jgi:hypothetical protein